MRDYDFYYTQDGSIGLYSYADDDVYHSKYGALTEAWQKFVLPSNIKELLNVQNNIRILDLCYGIGYNTKAILSYIFYTNEKILNKNNKNNFKNKIKNFAKILKINDELEIYIETIDTDNVKHELSEETAQSDQLHDKENILSKIKIDCLDINDELIKISPAVKTQLTMQEIYSALIPKDFTCFELYWKIKKKISEFSYKLTPKNKKRIIERLNVKFSNDYDIPDKEHKIHKFVNILLADAILEKYGAEYLNKELQEQLSDHINRRFFDRRMLRYLKFRYYFMQNNGFPLNLHNIYYGYISNRYKNTLYNQLSSLIDVKFYPDDARKTLPALNRSYDLIMLDAFTYSKAPELWSKEFLAVLYDKLSPRGILLTYSNSALVRNTLINNQFYVGKIVDEKTGKSIGTIASKDKTAIKVPLSNFELGLCSTKAGIPYHDFNLNSTREAILARREIEFNNSQLITASQYIKRRSLKSSKDDDETE